MLRRIAPTRSESIAWLVTIAFTFSVVALIGVASVNSTVYNSEVAKTTVVSLLIAAILSFYAAAMLGVNRRVNGR
jgi:hypothetical protein